MEQDDLILGWNVYIREAYEGERLELYEESNPEDPPKIQDLHHHHHYHHRSRQHHH